MNCQDVQEVLQADFDGDARPPTAALADHLVTCAACKRLHTASQRLRRGLNWLAPPSVPAGLLDRVVAAVRTDRRHRQRQRFRLAGALALAASVLVIALAGQMLPQPASPPSARPAEASIRETVNEASYAVARLTERTVDQAVDHTRGLLPTMDDSLLPMELPAPLEPPSLAGAGQGVSAGLEPLADSARRAFALFRRDLPPLGLEKKPEL
jgi:anti-sigma factor RsiW